MAGLTIMHQHHATLPTVRLAVASGGSGSPLLLLHAFPLDHSMWEAQNTLTDHLHLIVPDQRGFGGSYDCLGNQTGAVPSSLQSIAQLADDAVALLDAMEIRQPLTVCGISMGGYVAQHLATRYPHRVRSLILVATKLTADTPEIRAGRSDLAAKVQRLGLEILATAMIPRLLAGSAEALANPQRAEIEASLRRMIHAQSVPTIVAALNALSARPDMVAAMRSVRVPTLLIAGALDAITPPACLEHAASVIQNSRLVVVPEAGHMVPLESPALFNAAVLDFLLTHGADPVAEKVGHLDRVAADRVVADRVVRGGDRDQTRAVGD